MVTDEQPKKDQPAASNVDEYAPKYQEPTDAAVVEPEEKSGTTVGTATWECLTCGRTYTEDHGRCPDDGAPLRKTGPAAAAVGGKVAHSTENIERPASRPEDTPEGRKGATKGSHGEEPSGGALQGEQAAPPRGPGETSGM